MKVDIAVKAIIYNRRLNKILLLQRCPKDEIGAGTWEGPGGNIEEGETPEQAMVREIREETGLQNVTINKVAYVSLVTGKHSFLIIAYLCETEEEEITLSEEHQDILWASKKECMELLPQMIIEDFEKNGIFELYVS